LNEEAVPIGDFIGFAE